VNQDGGTPIRLPDIEYVGPNLSLPDVPDDLPYSELEDWKSTSILAHNGVDEEVDRLAEALRTLRDSLLLAAAHASWRFPQLAESLRNLLDDPDDAVQVEAAYSLARQGDQGAVESLLQALQRPVGAYLSPLTAAGYLAQLGDPSGYPVVRDSLGSDLRAVNMLACKQLLFFLPLDGQNVGSHQVDAVSLFTRAFADPDPDIGEQARAELEHSSLPAAARLLSQAAD
jgi:HEAT repeat protein